MLQHSILVLRTFIALHAARSATAPRPTTAPAHRHTGAGRTTGYARKQAAATDSASSLSELGAVTSTTFLRHGSTDIAVHDVASPQQHGPTCGMHTAVNAQCRHNATHATRKRAWRRIRHTWQVMARAGEISAAMADGHHVSVAMMHAASPADHIAAGRSITVSTERAMSRADALWISRPAASNLQAGGALTLRIRCDTEASRSTTAGHHW